MFKNILFTSYIDILGIFYRQYPTLECYWFKGQVIYVPRIFESILIHKDRLCQQRNVQIYRMLMQLSHSFVPANVFSLNLRSHSA